jgi:hypothetical protein
MSKKHPLTRRLRGNDQRPDQLQCSLKTTRSGVDLIRLFLIAATILSCAVQGCGGPANDIVGKWRMGADTSAVVWEFSQNGAVQMGSTRGRYSFGDRERIKIETSSGTSVYEMELSKDHLTLKDPRGSKLEFSRTR